MADKFGSFKLPEVFVRPVSMAEGQRLQRIGRTARDPVKLRAIVAEMIPEPLRQRISRLHADLGYQRPRWAPGGRRRD